jgi:hypothetical protein
LPWTKSEGDERPIKKASTDIETWKDRLKRTRTLWKSTRQGSELVKNDAVFSAIKVGTSFEIAPEKKPIGWPKQEWIFKGKGYDGL